VFDAPPDEMIATALRQPDATAAVHRVAEQLRDAGLAQETLYTLFDVHRAQHAADEDESIHDAILDVLDRIVGYCNPSMKLYSTYLKT